MFEQKTTDGYVSVKLSQNSFDDSTYVARVPRDKVNLDNIVSDIAAGYPSLDPYVIIHAAELLKSQILKYLQQGKAVDVLELGTMYLAAKGTVGKDNPQVSDLPGISLKFTPSSAAKEAVSALSANSFMVSDPAPQISAVTSLYDGNTDGTLYQSYPVRLTGGKLKVDVDNEDSGIFFVPVTSAGTPSTEENTWIEVDTDYLPRNTASTLEFYIPSSVSVDTEYFIAVRTSYISASQTRSAPVTGYTANTVTVVSG